MLSWMFRRWLVCGLALAVVALIAFASWYFLIRAEPGRPYEQLTLSFDGTSDQLQHTVIVPTLDSPIPEGKSAIWCASFQLAWNQLKNDVAKEPVKLANSQVIADQLNNGNASEDDMNSADVFAAAGFAKDGIVERIREQMARGFPHAPQPKIDLPQDGAVAYAYLAVSAKFDLPFFDNDEPLGFADSAGKHTAVSSFGIRKKDDYAYEELRKQVQILYFPKYEEAQIPEFVLDPCKASHPYQIVLARLDRKATLAATLADVEQKIGADPKSGLLRSDHLLPRDTVLVPNIAWKVTRRFNELEGKDKLFLNPALTGRYLDTAMQTIQFRLDRSGAELTTESKVIVKPWDSNFLLNRPFLLYMKKRDGKHPFFVMWVDNAELLQKFGVGY